LGGFATAGARKTLRLHETQRVIGFALGGEAGARLARRLGMDASPDSLLRAVKLTRLSEKTAPRVLGVDEWAWRKGRNYGTILCDLERRQVIDLLPEASSKSFADWLRAHPGVEVISRDRGGAFSEGARLGAPQAVQVADRWHLLHNLGDCVERVLNRHLSLLKQLCDSDPASAHPSLGYQMATQESVGIGTATPEISRKAREHIDRLQHRRDRYEGVRGLHQRGVSIRQIALTLGLARKTVAKYIRAGVFVEPTKRMKRGSLLDPYIPYLRIRWDGGCRNAYQLLREVKAQGYSGGRSILMDRISQWRKETSVPIDRQIGMPICGVVGEKRDCLTPRRARYLLLRQSTLHRPTDQRLLDRLCEAAPEIRTLHALAQGFRDLVRERRSEGLRAWFGDADRSEIAELRSFARGLQRDLPAVEMALGSEWSNGQVEGQVGRLKLIKRQMYGRASFELLRQRVLNN